LSSVQRLDLVVGHGRTDVGGEILVAVCDGGHSRRGRDFGGGKDARRCFDQWDDPNVRFPEIRDSVV
jgi:hypothetical protein